MVSIIVLDTSSGELFSIETKARTIKGLKRACSWLNRGEYEMQWASENFSAIGELNQWLKDGMPEDKNHEC